MKKTISLLLSCIVIAALTYFAYAKRLQIAAKAWHWRHGNSAIVSGYQVHVPDGWLVTSQTDEDLDLIATRAGEHGTVFANILVGTVRPRSSYPRDLTFWRLHQRQWLENRGLKEIDERTLDFDGATALYIDGERFPNATVLNLVCMSTSPLNFIFFGQKSELPQFEAVVSGIHKH